MIHHITRTTDLPSGWMEWFQLQNPDEAERVADGREGWLMESKIILAWYLFIPAQVEL